MESTTLEQAAESLLATSEEVSAGEDNLDAAVGGIVHLVCRLGFMRTDDLSVDHGAAGLSRVRDPVFQWPGSNQASRSQARPLAGVG